MKISVSCYKEQRTRLKVSGDAQIGAKAEGKLDTRLKTVSKLR